MGNEDPSMGNEVVRVYGVTRSEVWSTPSFVL